MRQGEALPAWADADGNALHFLLHSAVNLTRALKESQLKTKVQKIQKLHRWGAWLAQWEEHDTLNLRVMSLSPHWAYSLI